MNNQRILYAIGVDIGGTKIHAGCVDANGRIIAETTVPTLAMERRVMEQTMTAIDDVLEQLRELAPSCALKGIGVGSAGQIDFSSGSVLSATALIPGYSGTPIRSLLELRYGLPVYVDNDVNVIALAEKYYGLGRNVRHMICLALGTGVGGAIVTNGSLVHGARGAAGELGHCSVDFRGPVCNCGNVGCLELYASGTGLERMMNEKGKALGIAPIGDARDIFRLLKQGDRMASEVIADMIDALSTALAGYIHMLNPELIVLGGGVADSLEFCLELIRTKTRQKTMASMYANVRIELTAMGKKSGMVGAATQIWEYGGLNEQ